MSPVTVRVPSQRPLAPSVASVTAVANDKGDDEMILEAVHRSPRICLTAEENPRKPQLGRVWIGVHGTIGCGQNSFTLVWQCHQLLPGFLAKGHLPRVSRQSRRSLMIRVIMK